MPELTSKARKRPKNKPNVAVTEKTANPTERQAPKGKTQVKVVQPTKAAATKASTVAPVVAHEEHLDEEQPFTVVGPTRNKNSSTTKTNVRASTEVKLALVFFSRSLTRQQRRSNLCLRVQRRRQTTALQHHRQANRRKLSSAS